MNLEQVKEHFKYAKEVRCAYDGEIFDITKKGNAEIKSKNDGFWIDDKYDGGAFLYNSDINQLAEILTYIFDRGEEVEVMTANKEWVKRYFIGFSRKGEAITETESGSIYNWKHIRKLTPESLLEPQLTELKKKAKEMNCTVTVIFENK